MLVLHALVQEATQERAPEIRPGSLFMPPGGAVFVRVWCGEEGAAANPVPGDCSRLTLFHTGRFRGPVRRRHRAL